MKLPALSLAVATLVATCSAATTAGDAPSKVHAAKAAGNETTAPTTTGSLGSLKQKTYGNEYHMPYVRVVQARVQSDKPEYVQGRFVSKFGKGDLALGYRSGLDTVNTASVEGALLYVQAEGINQNGRSAKLRCERKTNMTYIVLYEILIAQPNETIAQYQDKWNVPEYGPMTAMDDGSCTPLEGKDKFPSECLQFNGDEDQPALGPYVGAGAKDDDVRAPYPQAIWFSFPNTCPLKPWKEKSDPNNVCRATTRQGLCALGQAPDGVACTFAYDILGYVPIDDVVGITHIVDTNSGKNYTGFKQWCEASEDHVEFAGDIRYGTMDKGLPFWEEPLDKKRNAERASKVIDLYQDIINGVYKSGQVEPDDLKHFKVLPSPTELAAANPPCYKTVRGCNSGFGCKRSYFSQICMTCSAAAPECKLDPKFQFPTLAKAPTKLPDSELTSGSKLSGKNGATGRIGAGTNNTVTTAPSADKSAAGVVQTTAVAAVVLAVMSVLAM